MSKSARILIVDDDPQLRRALRASLLAEGYEIQVAEDADHALPIVSEWKPDMVITDLAMPNVSGMELCRRLRAKSSVPIIVLSVKSEEQIKIECFEIGADDYVTKPFSTNELLARVKANLRRSGAVDQPPRVIEAGDFRVDVVGRRVSVRGVDVRLTPKEFDVLVYLLRRPGAVVTHRTLLGAVWGPECFGQTEALRVLIGQLRKKIEPSSSSRRYIQTEPWIGYRFDPGE